MSENLHSDIYNKALDIISRREHSIKEVNEKLTKKFNADEIIESVIEKLLSNNLINDSRFAEMYTSARKKKGFGPKRIGYELSLKGCLLYTSDAADE